MKDNYYLKTVRIDSDYKEAKVKLRTICHAQNTVEQLKQNLQEAWTKSTLSTVLLFPNEEFVEFANEHVWLNDSSEGKKFNEIQFWHLQEFSCERGLFNPRKRSDLSEIQRKIRELNLRIRKAKNRTDFLRILRCINQLRQQLHLDYRRVYRSISYLKTVLMRFAQLSSKLFSSFVPRNLSRIFPETGKDEAKDKCLNHYYLNSNYLSLTSFKNEKVRQRIY